MNQKFIASLKRKEDGRVIIPFKNKNGEVFGEFCFDPTDVGIVDRLGLLQTNIYKACESLMCISKISPEGIVIGCDIKSRMLMRKAEADAKKGFDGCFGNGTYDALFSKRRAFAAVGGNFFVTLVLEALSDNVFTSEES